jgi:Rieske Fe-S protein
MTGPLQRRSVLGAGLVAPAALAGLAGCGGSEESAPEPAATSADAGGAAGALATQDVPVGGAAYVEDGNTVVTQPTEGEFRAFDATCPHQGCAVNQAVDGELKCPCHDSRFDLTSGELLGGPAQTGLTERAVSLEGDQLRVGEGR